MGDHGNQVPMLDWGRAGSICDDVVDCRIAEPFESWCQRYDSSLRAVYQLIGTKDSFAIWCRKYWHRHFKVREGGEQLLLPLR